jgi:hypothetical protein
MKKYFSVLLVMFTMVLMNSSCEKDPGSGIPTEIKTLADLNGTWEFVNFHTPTAGDYTSCTNLPYSNVLVSLKFSGSTCTVTDKCRGVIAQDWPATLDSKHIMISNGLTIPQTDIEYSIKSYSNGILVLYAYISRGNPLTSELTLKFKE